MIRSPCKDCKERHDLCHSKCKKYNKYKSDVEKFRREEKYYNANMYYAERYND